MSAAALYLEAELAFEKTFLASLQRAIADKTTAVEILKKQPMIFLAEKRPGNSRKREIVVVDEPEPFEMHFTKKNRPRQRRQPTCRKCNKPGHISRWCPGSVKLK